MPQLFCEFRRNALLTLGLLVLTASWVCACGELPVPAFLQTKEVPSVVLASYKQLTEKTVLAGSYIVAFQAGGASSTSQFASYLREYQTHYMPLADSFLTDPKIKDIFFITSVDLSMASLKRDDFAEFAPSSLRLAWLGSATPTVASIARVDFATPEDAGELLHEWDKAGRIWFAEPNHFNKVFQSPNPFIAYKESYSKGTAAWHKQTKLLEAFESMSGKTLSAEAPIIAIMDSGVDTLHAELTERVWQNPSVGSAGCSNDINGCNTTTTKKGSLGDGDVFPVGTDGAGKACTKAEEGVSKDDENCSHGTHVAGIVAGKDVSEGGSSRGGMCPVCQIMAIRIIGVGADGNIGALDSSIIAGLKYVTLFRKSSNLAIRVINASFGKFVRSRAVDILIRVLNETGNGALVIAASGNEDVMQMSYPAAFSDALAVAAVDADDKKSRFSNFGSWVDISAPGFGIIATLPGGSFGPKNGTSMATPIVAGIAGLVLAVEPGLSASALKERLTKTADPRIYTPTGDNFNQYYYPKVSGEDFPQPLLGTGVVDAKAAVDNTPNRELPVYIGLDRVTSQCGTIGLANSAHSLPLLLLFFSLPLFMAWIAKACRSSNGFRK